MVTGPAHPKAIPLESWEAAGSFLTGIRNSYARRRAETRFQVKQKGISMLSWALTFLIIALIAALLGFGGIAGSAAWIAQVLFVLFIILFLVSFLFRGRPPRP